MIYQTRILIAVTSKGPRKTGMKLLVSVRSVTEAQAALHGGADLIDVKDPARGSLGRPDNDVLAEIFQLVQGRAPRGAAMGEMKDASKESIPPLPLDYAKFGLAESSRPTLARNTFAASGATSTKVVPAMYADCERAEAPGIQSVIQFVIDHRFPVLLIDTFVKDGRGLFDWLSERELIAVVERLHGEGIELALAGSLTVEDLPRIREISPDWLAVRGAVCGQGNRLGDVDGERVAELKAACRSGCNSV